MMSTTTMKQQEFAVDLDGSLDFGAFIYSLGCQVCLPGHIRYRDMFYCDRCKVWVCENCLFSHLAIETADGHPGFVVRSIDSDGGWFVEQPAFVRFPSHYPSPLSAEDLF